MKTKLFFLGLSMYVCALQAGDCNYLNLFPNRYYVQAKMIDIEDNLCSETAGMIRAINIRDQFYPGMNNDWNRRNFYINKSVIIFKCESLGVNCQYISNSNWTAYVDINSILVLDYVFKVQDENHKQRIVFQIAILERIQ